MTGQIPWWQSRTIWFGLAQALIGIVVALGLLTDEQGSGMLGSLDTILGLVMAALATGQIQGRWTATKEIKTGVAPEGSTPPGGKP